MGFIWAFELDAKRERATCYSSPHTLSHAMHLFSVWYFNSRCPEATLRGSDRRSFWDFEMDSSYDSMASIVICVEVSARMYFWLCPLAQSPPRRLIHDFRLSWNRKRIASKMKSQIIRLTHRPNWCTSLSFQSSNEISAFIFDESIDNPIE